MRITSRRFKGIIYPVFSIWFFMIKDNPTGQENSVIDGEKHDPSRDFQQIFDLSPDMIGFADLKGFFQKINNSFERILGYTPEEFCSKPFLHFVHEDDLERTREALLSASRGKALIEIENRYRCKNGELRWIDWKVWDTGKGDRYIAVGRDITDRKTMKESLTASEHRYNIITAAAQDFIFIKNVNRQYTFVNPAMARLFGLKPEDLIGKTPEEFFEPEVAAVITEVDDRTFKGENVNEVRPLKIGDKEYVFHTIQIPLDQINGEISSISGIVRDITEIITVKEQEKELEAHRLQIQKLEAIGTLAGGIAHDFNNMLGVILGNVSYALHDLDRESPLYNVLSNIQKGALQAQTLTQQLLTFARGGAPIKQATDLNRLIKESARFVTSGSRSTCIFNLAEDLWPADVDPGQVNQAIGNIVLNACQAMPDGGTIHIQTENTPITPETASPLSPGKYIKITVKDRGVGISEKNISRIFDPYFSTKQQGSGLGLAVTYSIVTRHGGFINAHSKIDYGTTIILFLPACTGAHEKKQKEMTAHQGEGRILIMDDHEQILIMSEIMFNQMGYTTTCALDGARAIELYRRAFQSGEPFDLVILDLTVPGGMGGEETIAELLRINPEIKAIVSSGYSNDPVMADCKAYGFCGVLPKPYTIEQVAEILNKIFKRTGHPDGERINLK